MLCWIALPIFAILGIFSARYRKLTKESLDCMFRTFTLRKCRSGLDERIKSDVTGKLMRVSPTLARGFYKHYKVIAFIILIIFLWSAYVSAVSVYNYYKYGNCNGEEGGFCILSGSEDLAKEKGIDREELERCIAENQHSEEECIEHCLG